MNRISRSLVHALLPLISAICLTCASCSDTYRTADGVVWGTTYHITYRADRNLDAAIQGAMSSIDSTFSMFNPASAVSAINRGEQVVATDELAELLELSLRVNRISGGAFDPTVGPLVRLWGFGPDGLPDVVPADSTIAAALTLVGIDRCQIDSDGIVRLPAVGSSLDFSAIAKGYGVDKVARALRAAGVTDYLVEIGGEVAVGGRNPHGQPWHVQIDAPLTDCDGHQRLTVLALDSACAMATSGNYRNYHAMPNGTVVSHTISPLTGRPVAGTVLSATVIAPTCALADALATAVMAMDSASAHRMIADMDVCARVVVAAPDSTFRVLEW